jgi:Chromate resistance exported protein
VRPGSATQFVEGGIEGWIGAGLRRAIAFSSDVSSEWITRERPEIDRIASPWLIRRFHRRREGDRRAQSSAAGEPRAAPQANRRAWRRGKACGHHPSGSQCNAPREPSGTSPAAPAIDLDTVKLDEAMGAKGKAHGGVYPFTGPRRDPVTENAMTIPAGQRRQLSTDW